jgi:membrane protease YdiL (CAAX protease family)
METIGNESKTKRFGKAAIDIVSFAALAVIIITIISVPFATVLLKLGKEEADTMSYFILSETLMLAGVFLSAWIVWHFRGFSLEGLGRSLTMRWKDWLSGILLATVLYAVGFGISLWAGAVEIAGVAFNPSSLLISLVFFLLVAVTEELALRGFVLERLLQSGVNKFCALFLSAALFLDSYRQSELRLSVFYQHTSGRHPFRFILYIHTQPLLPDSSTLVLELDTRPGIRL